ncbi:transcriptional regulator [Methylophilaceae bacterium Uisw_097]
MITGSQIRAAKALLDWTGNDLASKAGVSLSSIRRVEAVDDVPKNVSVNTILNIQKALEQGGVEFIGTPDKQPGVRLK